MVTPHICELWLNIDEANQSQNIKETIILKRFKENFLNNWRLQEFPKYYHRKVCILSKKGPKPKKMFLHDYVGTMTQLKKKKISLHNPFKVTGHSKKIFVCPVSPFSTRLFWTFSWTFKRTSLRLFRFKISQCVPFLHIFDWFCGFLIKKGTHCEILNLDNRRLVLLKVHVI